MKQVRKGKVKDSIRQE